MSDTDGLTLEWTPSQADFDLFAELSGDDNPIHVDPDFSGRTRFGRTVSHGMLLHAKIWAMVRRLHPGRRHRMQHLMFPNPAYAGEPLRLTVRPKPGEADVLVTEIVRRADDLPALIGECVLEARP